MEIGSFAKWNNCSVRSVINAYDEMGRVKSYTQGYYENSQWQDYASLSSYDLAGNRISETYPSGRQVVTGYSGSDRLSTLATNDILLLSGITYAPFGGLAAETYGSGLIRAMQYNSRAQLTEIKLGNLEVSDSILRLNYIYGTATSVNDADEQLLQNSGNIGRMKYTIGGSLKYSQTFQYDQLNRIKFAVEHDDGVLTDAKRAWWQTFDYDRWGNRGLNSNTSPNMNQSGSALGISDFSSSTNRISKTGFFYDDAGNVIVVPGRPNDLFNGENKLTSSTANSVVSTYVYDADGRRVKKTVGTAITKFVYNAEGQLIAEYEESGTAPGFTMLFATADHLGSPRVWTIGSGVAANGRHDYAPFGEELGAAHGAVRSGIAGYSASSQADGQKRQFTGKHRDSESGLDYFGARYATLVQGRFTGVDPLLSSAHTIEPQSWNRYAYTLNNPLRFVDLKGLYVWGADAGGSTTDEELRRRRQDTSLSREERNRAKDALSFRDRFRAALDEAIAAASALPAGSEKDQALRGVYAFGNEGSANGVTVTTGHLAHGRAGQVSADPNQPLSYDERLDMFTANVVATFQAGRSGNDLTITIGHEGSHVADRRDFAGAARAGNDGLNGPFNLSRYATEFNAFTVSSLMAQGLGMPNLSYGGHEVWNSGWRAADRATFRANGINEFLRTSPHYLVTLQAQGPPLYPRQ